MVKSRKQQTPQETTCAHHWIIEPSRGGPSPGTCQKCRETKEFQNSITFTQRDTDSEDKRSAILKQMDYQRNHP